MHTPWYSEDSERLAAREMLRVFEALRMLDGDMPVAVMSTLMWVALNEGAFQRDIAPALGLPQSTASRTLFALSATRKVGVEGLDLITWTEDSQDRRQKRLFLTPKGRSFVRNILPRFAAP